MDWERVRGILGCFGILAGIGALLWVGSLWLGWTHALAGIAVLTAAFHLLIQRWGSGLVWVAVALGIVSASALLGPEAGKMHWIGLIWAVLLAYGGSRAAAREAHLRRTPQAFLAPEDPNV